MPCTSPVGSDPHPVTTPNDAYLLPCGLPHHPTKVVWEAPFQNICIAGVTEGEALGACHGDEATRCYAPNGATQGGVHGRVHACAQRRERTRLARDMSGSRKSERSKSSLFELLITSL